MNLFPINEHNAILFNEIITSISQHIDSMNGLERQAAEYLKQDVNELEKRITRWKTYADVIRAVAYHEEELNRITFMYEKRPWRNEWDVPLELFNEALGETIAFTSSFCHPNSPKVQTRMKQRITLLEEVLSFRNQSLT